MKYVLVGTGVLDGPRHIIFSGELVFSADLYYIGANKKPPSEREGDRVSGGRSLRNFGFSIASLSRALPHPTPSGAPSRREPLVLCIFRGMGFALCLCNTKAKLKAIPSHLK